MVFVAQTLSLKLRGHRDVRLHYAGHEAACFCADGGIDEIALGDLRKAGGNIQVNVGDGPPGDPVLQSDGGGRVDATAICFGVTQLFCEGHAKTEGVRRGDQLGGAGGDAIWNWQAATVGCVFEQSAIVHQDFRLAIGFVAPAG